MSRICFARKARGGYFHQRILESRVGSDYIEVRLPFQAGWLRVTSLSQRLDFCQGLLVITLLRIPPRSQ